MEILRQIDQLISSLTELKPYISDKNNEMNKNFNDELNTSIKKLSALTDASYFPPNKLNASTADIPKWVDKNYYYDPDNPRNPNTREVMQALSGKSFEELQIGDQRTFSHYSELSIELVFGVLGKSLDTRDWQKIMSSDNILEAARKETGEVLGTKIDIETETDINGHATSQYAVIKDKENNTLRSLLGDEGSTLDTLKNFGVTTSAIPKNLEEKVTFSNFDKTVIKAIEAYRTQNAIFNHSQSDPNGIEADISEVEKSLLVSAAHNSTNRLTSEILNDNI